MLTNSVIADVSLEVVEKLLTTKMAAAVETAVVNKMLTDAKPKLNSKFPQNMLSKAVMLSYTSTIMLDPIML